MAEYSQFEMLVRWAKNKDLAHQFCFLPVPFHHNYLIITFLDTSIRQCLLTLTHPELCSCHLQEFGVQGEMPAGLLKSHCKLSLLTCSRRTGERVINKTHASIWVSQQECNSTPWLEIKHVLPCTVSSLPCLHFISHHSLSYGR